LCYYITGIISKKSNLRYINMVGKVFGMEFRPCKNRFVSAQLEADELYIWKYTDLCDCGTALGKESQSRMTRRIHLESGEAPQETRSEKADKLQLEDWLNFLEIILVEKKLSGKIGLMLHFYEGRVSDEKVRILRREDVKATEKQLSSMEEDILYVYSA